VLNGETPAEKANIESGRSKMGVSNQEGKSTSQVSDKFLRHYRVLNQAGSAMVICIGVVSIMEYEGPPILPMT
jgi:hypothetical protein